MPTEDDATRFSTVLPFDRSRVRTLAVIGSLTAIYFIWSFYWDLEGTLLTKSIILMSAGAVLLLCYGLLVGALRERRPS